MGINKLTTEKISELCRTAIRMRDMSYSPYSRFCVGAALLASDGSIHTGCNIENAAYGPSNCAERTAFFKAVSEGYRSFVCIAIAGGPYDGELSYCPPCGICRQVMAEFCGEDFKIIPAKSEDDYKIFSLGELLPERFGPDNLG